ncbi:MAG: hypothetical protein AAGA92_15500 [Planctomycetota bacterium]
MNRRSWSRGFLLCVMLAASPHYAHAEEQPTAKPEAAAAEGKQGAEAPVGIEQLGWLVGDWVNDGNGADEGGGAVETSVRWAANNRFLTRVFSVTNEEGATLSGTQVIGWDPAEQQIRSWTFDTEGGFGEAYWTPDGSQWLVRKTFTLSTGEKASALNVLTVVDENTVIWQSLNRQLGKELLPSIEPIKIIRKTGDAAMPAEGGPSEEDQQ